MLTTFSGTIGGQLRQVSLYHDRKFSSFPLIISNSEEGREHFLLHNLYCMPPYLSKLQINILFKLSLNNPNISLCLSNTKKTPDNISICESEKIHRYFKTYG